MRSLLWKCLILVPLLMACEAQQQIEPSNTLPFVEQYELDLSIVEAYWTAYAEQDMNAIEEILADDLIAYGIDYGLEMDKNAFIISREEIHYMFEIMDLLDQKTNPILDAVNMEYQGIGLKQWIKAKHNKTGVEVFFKMYSEFYIKDGTVHKVDVYYDSEDIYRQVKIARLKESDK